MNISLLDLTRGFENIKSEIFKELEKIWDSQYFILGKNVEEFENSFKDYCQTKYAVGVASGSDGILLSCMALDVGPDSAIITTPFTFFATVGSFVRLGAVPIFCDINPETFNMDEDKLENILNKLIAKDGKLYTPKSNKEVKCIMPVHLYGQPVNINKILALANKFSIPIIEDACQAVGASVESKMVGSFGVTGAFSFFPSKNLGGCGDGGMITTNSDDIYKKLISLRNHGMSEKKYVHDKIGINSRLDEIQAAVLKIKLKYLNKYLEARRAKAQFYTNFINKKLPEYITPPKEMEGVTHTYHQYVIRVNDRDNLSKFLSENNIGNTVYYPVSLNKQPCLQGMDELNTPCPESERAQNEVLALPIYPELKEEEQMYVLDKLGEFYK